MSDTGRWKNGYEAAAEAQADAADINSLHNAARSAKIAGKLKRR